MTKTEALAFTKRAAQIADEKLGQEIVALDVSKESSLADYFVFITGTSHVHIRAMEDSIREAMKSAGGTLTRTDGQRGHLWRVLDYGAVIVHLMDAKTREFYSIERLWERGRPVQWGAKKAVAKPKTASRKAAAVKTVSKKTAAKRVAKK
jgi:ribosome-associated protein